MRGKEPEGGLPSSERKKLLEGLAIDKKVAVTGLAAAALIFTGYEIWKHKKQSSQSSPSEPPKKHRQ